MKYRRGTYECKIGKQMFRYYVEKIIMSWYIVEKIIMSWYIVEKIIMSWYIVEKTIMSWYIAIGIGVVVPLYFLWMIFSGLISHGLFFCDFGFFVRVEGTKIAFLQSSMKMSYKIQLFVIEKWLLWKNSYNFFVYYAYLIISLNITHICTFCTVFCKVITDAYRLLESWMNGLP